MVANQKIRSIFIGFFAQLKNLIKKIFNGMERAGSGSPQSRNSNGTPSSSPKSVERDYVFVNLPSSAIYPEAFRASTAVQAHTAGSGGGRSKWNLTRVKIEKKSLNGRGGWGLKILIWKLRGLVMVVQLKILVARRSKLCFVFLTIYLKKFYWFLIQLDWKTFQRWKLEFKDENFPKMKQNLNIYLATDFQF